MHFTNYFTRIFIIYIWVEQNCFFKKLSRILDLLDLVWGGIQYYNIKGLCFWCSLYKIIGNQGFFSYSRYNLLAIAIKIVVQERFLKFPTLCNTLNSKNSTYMTYNRDDRRDVSLSMRFYKKIMQKTIQQKENVK